MSTRKVKPMKKLIVYFVTVCLYGCISINSEMHDDRMKALGKLETEEEFSAALFESKYDDVHRVAIAKIGDQQTLVKVVSSGKFSEDVICEALSRISNQEFLSEIAASRTTSERKAVAAANGISDAQLLSRCALETRHEIVAKKCIDKISDERLLQSIVFASGLPKTTRLCALAKVKTQKALGNVVVRCPDDWVHEYVLPKIVDADVIKYLLINPDIEDRLKMAFIDKTEDNETLHELIANRANAEQLRRKALSRAKSATVFSRLLKARPIYEDWINAYAVDKTSDNVILRMVVTSTEFSENTRKNAFAKLKTAEDFAAIFSGAKDELAATLSFPLLEEKYICSPDGQLSLLNCFRTVSQCELANAVFTKLNLETLDELYRRSDQVRIAKAVSARPTSEVLSKSQDALFDSDVLLSMALGEYGENAALTQWVLSMNPCEDVLLEMALKAKYAVSRGLALAKIHSEKALCKIAQDSSALALRLAAIERLTTNSEDVLKALAHDKDMTVRTSSIKRMKTLGSDKSAELEKIAKDEQRKIVEARKRKHEEQIKLDMQEKMAFEDKVLRTVGTIQLKAMKKYHELKSKANIKSPCFTFSGRVVNVEGRIAQLLVYTEDGERQLMVELSNKCKSALVKDEIIVVAGYDNESTDSEYRLCKCEVRERGIDIK